MQARAPMSRRAGYIIACPSGSGAHITTDMITVTAPRPADAATLAEGETVLENAAQEPEFPIWPEMLIKRREIEATARAHPHPGRRATSRLAPSAAHSHHPADRDGDFLCAVAATGGDVVLGGQRRPPQRGDDKSARSGR